MARIAELSVGIVANTSGFVAGLTKARQATSDFAAQAEGSLTKSLGKVALQFATVGAAAGLFLKSIRLAADAESSQTAFSVLLKDGAKAKQLLSELRTFAAKTPFAFTESRDAAGQLLAVGVAAEQVTGILRRLGDIGSLTNNPIGELTALYAKAMSRGKLQAEDLNQLSERRIPIVKALASVLGVAEAKVRDLVTEGKVGFSDLDAAIKSMTDSGGQFADGMGAASKDFTGMWSNIKDDLESALTDIGMEILPALKELLPVMAELIKGAVMFAKPIMDLIAWADSKRPDATTLELEAAASQVPILGLAFAARGMARPQPSVLDALGGFEGGDIGVRSSIAGMAGGVAGAAKGLVAQFNEAFRDRKGPLNPAVAKEAGDEFGRAAGEGFAMSLGKGGVLNMIGENMLAEAGFDKLLGKEAGGTKGEFTGNESIARGSVEALRFEHAQRMRSAPSMDALSVARSALDEAKLQTAELKRIAAKNPIVVLEAI